MTDTSWWVVLLGAVVGALIGLGGTLLTSTRQNVRARREEWFRRVQWAQTLTTGPDDARRAAGLRVLNELARSDLATPDDIALIDALRQAPELRVLNEKIAQER